MPRVQPSLRAASAYQYRADTVDELKQLELPTGPVSFQLEDEMNNTEGRAYVTTAWGTSVLSYGAWIVHYDIGIVSTFTDAQFVALFEAEAIPDQPLTLFNDEKAEPFRLLSREEPVSYARQAGKAAAVERFAAEVSSAELPDFHELVSEESVAWKDAFERFCTRRRLDYSIVIERIPHMGTSSYRVVVNATGRLVAEFSVGDRIRGYSDGRIEVLKP